jgi:hypothetical protein
MTLAKPLAVLAVLAATLAGLPPGCRADVLEARSPAAVTLQTNAFVNTNLLSMTLPAAGQYWAVAKASAVNWTGQEDYTRCGMSLNHVVLDAAVTAIGGAVAPPAATLFTEAKVTTTAPNQVLTVDCSHDHALAGIYVDGGASLELTSSPPGPPGDAGATGARGVTGPTSSTFGVCASVNPALPTSQSCGCPAGKLLAQVQSAATCTVATQSGPCSASGNVAPGGPGSPSYAGACCVCHS